MFAQIGDALPRFRIYRNLFSNHELLLVSLSKAYLDVLQFCVTTKEFFAKERRSFSKPYQPTTSGTSNRVCSTFVNRLEEGLEDTT